MKAVFLFKFKHFHKVFPSQVQQPGAGIGEHETEADCFVFHVQAE